MNFPFKQSLKIGCIVFFAILLTSTTSAQTEEEAKVEEKEEKKVNLTGIPQIDYIHDPNLPRELGTYNLSSYPFYNRLPEDVANFTCDGRHDGFYASIPHKCQVYHNCLFGIRYSFICANYTAFDQVNLNCAFVNRVDCKKSHLLYDLNANLYIEPTTTTLRYRPDRSKLRPKPPRKVFLPRPKKGTTTTEEPYYEYEYEDKKTQQDYDTEYYYYEDYVEPTTTTPKPVRRPARPFRPIRRQKPARIRAPPQEIDSTLAELEVPPGRVAEIPTQVNRPGLKRVRRPLGQQNVRRRPFRRRRKKKTTTTTTTTTTAAPEYYDEYYDYYYDYYEDEVSTTTTTTTTTPAPQLLRGRPGKLRRRPVSRRIGRPPQARQNQEAAQTVEEQIPHRAVSQSSRSSAIRNRANAGRLEPQESIRITRTLIGDVELKGRPIKPGVFRRPVRRKFT